jgi:hypothetical protein
MFRSVRSLRPMSALALVVPVAACSGPGGCGEPRGSTASVPATAPSGAPSGPSDGGGAVAALADAGSDAGYVGPWLGSTVLHAPVFSEMEWPGDKHGESDHKSHLLGYLRYGQKVPVIADAHKKPNCAEGWYELLYGGFVCAKYVTLDLDHPRFKLANPPDLDAALPYTYGLNLANGTPLYRSVPSRKERLKYEPWLTGRPRKAKTEDDNPYASAPAAPDAGETAPDAGETPWYQRESPDGGPPAVTLEDLEEGGGPVARRMVKGFFLSLDHQFDAAGTTWWKTVDNFTAPSDRILVAKLATEFHGVWFGRDDATYPTKNYPAHRIDKLPVAFVMHGSKRWTLDDAHKKFEPAEGALDRYDAVGLTGEKARIMGIEFWQSTEGWWVRSIDVARTEPLAPPERLGPHEKWIDVNLKMQTLVAFEGQSPVYATMVSSGRNEHETVPGSFRIREKHIAATMDADTAADGPYSIQDVPYIEYFNGSYALHGAFWHAAFGVVKSHGCVNLAPWDAKAIFGWTDPQLPEGWHAAYATKDHPGTRVIVHDKAPGTCEGPEAQPPECPDVPAH